MDPRKRRIAENESRFREINDRLGRDLAGLPSDGEQVPFVCECGMLDCTDSVELTLDEYSRVRQDAMCFAVIPGHQIEDTEDVIARTERFVVVRKHAEAAPVVDGQ